MRRWIVLAAIVALQASAVAQSGQVRPLQADGVVRLLADLEQAIGSGRAESLRALVAAAFPSDDERLFTRATRNGTPSTAVVRELARGAASTGPGFDVLVDVLVAHGRKGRLTTWQVRAVPQDDSQDRYQLAGIRELAAVDGLWRLELDPAKQFAVTNFSLQAPDYTLSMESGWAFVAETESGVTALVLRGRGGIHFAPANRAEQGQLRLFAGKPAFTSKIDSAFVRLNPHEFGERVAASSLKPVPVNPVELRRAQNVFEEFSGRSYNLDLGTLTPERWSLEPGAGHTIVETRTSDRGWLTYARSPNEAEDVTFFDRGRNKNISVYASPERLLLRGPHYSEDDESTYDVVKYGVDLSMDPSRLWVAGRGSLHVRIKAFGVTSLTVKLAPALTVSSVTSPEFGRLLALRIVGQSNVIVSLPRQLNRAEDLTLEIAYSGRLEPQGLDREAIAVQGTTQAAQQGLQDPAPSQTTIPIVLPEPRFMYSNRVAWYPQAPVSDYATASLRLTVPSEYQIVASGTLMRSSVSLAEADGRSPARGMRTVEYAADEPVRYLACVISRFVPIARSRIDLNAPVNLEIVSTPRMAGRNRHTLQAVTGMVKFYAGLLGEAPYPDFTLAALDDNLPGGHSPPYFAMLHQELPSTPYVWATDPVALSGAFAPFFLAHEVAHQWWGQAVGWKNYHEHWLSEGLAHYFAALYAERERGPALLRTLLADMRDSARPLVPHGPIALGYRLGHLQSDGRVFRALVYNKSAVVLHMLRQLVGDDAFFAGLRKFYADWKFKKAGTDDLRLAMEAHTPLKLERFFDRWIGGAAPARIRFSSRLSPDGQTASVRIEQVGDLFDLPVTVAVQYADGTTEDVVVKVHDAVVDAPIKLKGPARRLTMRDDITPVEIVR
jgi:hypothetical protein